VADLSLNAIVREIDALTGKPGAVSDLRKATRSFLGWAVSRGLAKFNPMAGLRLPGKTRAQRLLEAEEKGKALDDCEIVALWCAGQALQDRAARGEPVSGSFGAVVQLALLTGCRRGELAQLRHDFILTGDRVIEARCIKGDRIHLPASVTKSASDHHIHLTQMMRRVIEAQPRRLSPLLFPSRMTGGRLSAWDKYVAALRRDSGVLFQMHDLRRTTRTLMSRLGVAEDIAELAIGHQRADPVGRYNKDAAWKARTEAFEQVSTHISALLAKAADGGNVVPMHGRDQR